MGISDFELRNADFGFWFTLNGLTTMSDQIRNQKSAIRNSLVECVPNFSEGRKPQVIEEIACAVETVTGATVLNLHIDVDHNRSVITFVAPPEVMVEAALRAVSKATELISLEDHTGEHPRIGATDVLPFVPVSGVTIDDCVTLAREAGQRIWNELSIPVYFYERAALRSDRVRLEQVRGKGFEHLRTDIVNNPDRRPDVGESRLHESAGAIAVGARPFLIAFNVTLKTNDIMIARRIARVVRERDGGLPFVKALGFQLHSQRVAQVSMNLTNYEQTSIATAFHAVRREAERLGVQVAAAEIVGLVPRAALDRNTDYFSFLQNFRETLVLETLLESVATPKPWAKS
jgi:glutamate formiminotransferase